MKKVLKAIVNVLAWIVLILALLVTIIVFSSGKNNGVANLFGFIPLTVESDSMLPTFKKGDLIICKEVDDLNTLKEGDVITFWTIIDGKKVKNTHRIVGINIAENSRSFITRGDNNNLEDDMPAYAGDIIGQWTEFKLGGAGKAMSFLRTKKGFFICIVIPMAIFFLIELYKFIITVQEVRKPVLTESDEEEIKRRAIEEYLASQNKDGGSKPEEKTEAKTEAKPAETAETPVESAPAEAAAPVTAETPTESTPAEAAAPETAETPTESTPAETAAPETAETPTESTPAEAAAPETAETPTEDTPAESAVTETTDTPNETEQTESAPEEGE